MSLPESLNEEILRRAVEGQGTREIAEWCTKKGHPISHESVAKRLRKLRGERADISKAVVREELSKTLTADVRRLDQIANDSKRLADAVLRRAMSGTRIVDLEAAEAYPKVAAAAIKATEAKLKAAGVDQPDDTLSELAAAADRVRRKLAGKA